MRIQLLADAEADLRRAAEFYEAQQQGLGPVFLDSVLADIELLKHNAGIHVRYFGFHRLLTRRFPYAVYYAIESEMIRVYAVLDCRQSPLATQYRLSDPPRSHKESE